MSPLAGARVRPARSPSRRFRRLAVDPKPYGSVHSGVGHARSWSGYGGSVKVAAPLGLGIAPGGGRVSSGLPELRLYPRERADRPVRRAQAVTRDRVVAVRLDGPGPAVVDAKPPVVCNYTVRITHSAQGARAPKKQPHNTVFRSRAELQIDHVLPAAQTATGPAPTVVVRCRVSRRRRRAAGTRRPRNEAVADVPVQMAVVD